jgi:hypothetical protein
MAEWQGVVKSTATKFLKGASDETIRDRLLLGMLENRGRIKYKQGGTQCTWNVRYNQNTMEGYGDGGSLDFARHDNFQQLNIDWRGYITTDMMTEKERLMNENEGGDLAIIKRYDELLNESKNSMRDRFAAEFYIDGYLAANTLRLHGLESFMGTGTVAAGDRIAEPSDTYGGLSTALANKGGTWSDTLSTQPNSTVSTDWPDGSGDPNYDYLSPKLINYSSTGWGTGSTTWEDNCERAIRQARIWMTHTGGKDGMPNLFMFASDLFYAYLNKQEAKQRLMVPFKEAEDLGFVGVPQQDGVGIYHEFDIPAATGYGFNFSKMELACLYTQLFAVKGPDFDMKTMAYLMACGFFGNMRYRPKHFCKFKNYA